ncbi:uncharacterized protein BJ171DRAFT_500122 [Polychytrium aggregatum]|uniref:uncharacterized protein n=1 Tax=Polychytrium aggregatum TaxID=110093 RepID=UPI0022FF42F7|nr:uncharacterized protein BJ171DRAFT_500122 [Polychytrium aggregatum]KAI9205922.1 hypothetical protein BJ171DRAFT_500122 [Polychytrium aggregatum]
MSAKRPLEEHPSDSSSSSDKMARLGDPGPHSDAATDRQDSAISTSTGRICAALASHDILTILVCNESFLTALDATTLVKLPELAPQYKDILSLLSKDGWVRFICSKAAAAPDCGMHAVLQNLGESIDPMDVLRGIVYFLTRVKGYPRSFEAYQNELPLWWAAASSSSLCDVLVDGLRLKCPYNKDLSDEQLCGNSSAHPVWQFRALDSSRILYYHVSTPCSGDYDCEGGCDVLCVARFAHHPFHTAEQVSNLLPHEKYALYTRPLGYLSLFNCSFMTISGWPDWLDHVSHLSFDCDSNFFDTITSLDGFPLMSQLENLTVSRNVPTLKGLPSELNSLSELDLSQCRSLANLEGLGSVRDLTKLTLPESILTLEGLPPYLSNLSQLDLTRCENLVHLKGFTEPRYLQVLQLPKGLRSLEGMPPCIKPLQDLDLSACVALRTLDGLSQLPYIRKLLLPPLLESLDIVYRYIDRLSTLDMRPCKLITSLGQCPSMKSMYTLHLPPSIESLEGLPTQLGSLSNLDMWTCDRLNSLKGLPPTPRLSRLKLPRPNGTARSLSDWIAWLRESPQWQHHVDPDGHLVSVLPKVNELWTPLSLGAIEALSETFLSVRRLHLALDESTSRLALLPPMPLASCVFLHGPMRNLMQLARGARALNMIELRCWYRGTFVGFEHELLQLPWPILYLCKELMNNGRVPVVAVASMADPGQSSQLDEPQQFPADDQILDLADDTEPINILMPPNIDSLEGMPPMIDFIRCLNLQNAQVKSLQGMPAMESLETLQLEVGATDLQGMPPVLPSLTTFNIRNCEQLTALRGMSAMRKLTRLSLPKSISTLDGIPRDMESLEEIDMSVCGKLKTLEGLPILPRLKKLVLPSSLKILGIPDAHIRSITELDASRCPKLEVPTLAHEDVPNPAIDNAVTV